MVERWVCIVHMQVEHVDENLFQEVSDRLCAAARAARAAARAAPPPAGQLPPQQGPGPASGRGVLHAGTVSRALWAFVMQGRHDDPLLPLLVPHARVRGVDRSWCMCSCAPCCIDCAP